MKLGLSGRMVSRIIAVGLLAGSGLMIGQIASASTPSPVAIVPVLNSFTGVPGGGSIVALSCTTATTCVAVGSDQKGQPLVLSGNPSTWTTAQAVELPISAIASGGSLTGISCTSATKCVAVGSDSNSQPLVVAGNPSTWGAAQVKEITLGAAFLSHGSLASVACTSATACVAVGSDNNGQPLVVAGNPANWTAAQAVEIVLGDGFGSGGILAGVTCTSATACVAVGSDNNGLPLSLSGNPSTWTATQAKEIIMKASFGSYGSLAGVTCTSATACVALGTSGNGQPLVVSGNPASWGKNQAKQIVLSSSFGSYGTFTGVTCTSATACIAVGIDGNGQPLVLSGNPATWGAPQAKEIGVSGVGLDYSAATGISCVSASACSVAFGSSVRQPIVLSGNPTSWASAQLHAVVLASTFGNFSLTAMTCTSTTACVAVGTNPSTRLPLVVSGNPATWGSAQAQQITLGASFGSHGVLNGVACTSATACVAVGVDDNYEPLVLAGNPATWTAAQAKEITLGASFGSNGGLSGIACTSATACVAVGSDAPYQPLVLAGNPATWTAAQAKEITLDASLGSNGGLSGIACTSATACVAVGKNQTGQPLVLAGRPSNWGRAQAKEITLGAPLGSAGELTSISCTSPTACVSVGSAGTRQSGITPLLLAGNPSTWTSAQAAAVVVAAAANTVGGFSANNASSPAAEGDFRSISCTTASNCEAVGQDGYGAPIFLKGNPTQWSGSTAVRPLSSNSLLKGSFDAVACASSSCYVIGQAANGSFLSAL